MSVDFGGYHAINCPSSIIPKYTAPQAMIWLGTQIKIPIIVSEGPWKHCLVAFHLSEVDSVISFIWKLHVLLYKPTKLGLFLNHDVPWKLLFYLYLLHSFISHVPSKSVWISEDPWWIRLNMCVVQHSFHQYLASQNPHISMLLLHQDLHFSISLHLYYCYTSWLLLNIFPAPLFSCSIFTLADLGASGLLNLFVCHSQVGYFWLGRSGSQVVQACSRALLAICF